MEQEVSSEILLKIFESLPQNDLDKTIPYVCKQWNDVSQKFHLSKGIIKLLSPFHRYCKRILKDLSTYPTFGSKINVIRILSLNYDDVNGFRSLMDACPNLEELIMLTNVSLFFFNILTEVEHITAQFNRLELYFVGLECQMYPMLDKDFIINTRAVDLSKLINNKFPDLHTLCIASRCDFFGHKQLAFVNDNKQLSTNCSIRKIEIIGFTSVMTKSCLEYIISGYLTNLEELSLQLILVDDNNKSAITREDSAVVSQKLDAFCAPSLKYYDIRLLTASFTNPLKFGNSHKNERFKDIIENYW